MQQTAEIIFSSNADGELIIPEEYEMKNTPDGVYYLVADDKVDIRPEQKS